MSESKKKKKYVYDYPDNKAIGGMMRHGDMKLIAEMTGHPKAYVYEVLSGRRNNKKIIEAAIRVNKMRDELLNADNY